MRRYFFKGRRLATLRFCWVIPALACLAAVTTTACRRLVDSAPDISIRQEVTPLPARVGESTVTVQLADKTASPLTHASMMVEADMAHPGMGPVFKAANEIAPGSYQAKINFTMGGDWVLLLHIKLPNGSKIERHMDVKGVRSN